MTTTKEQVRDSGSGTRRAGPDRPTLCFFYSPTSGPSRRVEAFLAQVLQRRQNHRTFELQRVNCDKHPELVERYAVTQMPTLIVIEGRHVLGRLEGSCGCREIEKLLEPWLNRGARARASRERNGTSPHTGAVVSSKASEDRVLSATTIRTTRRSTNWSTKPRERHGTEITEDRLTAGHTL